MVEALLVVIVICLIALAWYWRASKREVARLKDESKARLGELRAEHQKRVGRLERKLGKNKKRGHLKFAADLLPALDALGHALEQSERTEDVSTLRQGLEMVDRELVSVLARHGIERCSPQPGERFDPNVHEAVSIEETDAFEPGCVVECLRAGYVHDDRVLRAAAVSVTRKARAADQESVDRPSDRGDEAAQKNEATRKGDGADEPAGAEDQAEASSSASASPPEDVDEPSDDTSSSRV